MNYLIDIKSAFLPEIIIITFIFLNVILGLFLNKKYYKISRWSSLCGVLCAFCGISFLQAEPTYSAFNNTIICNVYTVFFKILILISAFFVILLSFKTIKKLKVKAFDFFAILFCAILSALLITCVNDFITAFVSLGALLISSTFLITISKGKNIKEAGLKYFTSGLLALSLFLLGSSYLYGITGSLNFDTISTSLIGYEGGLLCTIAIILIICGTLFFIGANPFDKWVVPVFEKSMYSIGLYLSLIPKLSGIAFLSRILILLSEYMSIISVMIIISAILSIICGLYGMLKTNNMKKYFAYNIVLQTGFILLVLNSINLFNLSGLLYCVIYYLITTIVFISGLMTIYNTTTKNELITYKGLAYNRPIYSTALIFILISLAGLAPTCGFLAKFFIISSIIRLGIDYFILLLIILLLCAITILAYFKPIKLLFEKSKENLVYTNNSIFSKTTFYVCVLILGMLCFCSGKIIELCELITYSL